jgi:urocanate hydratase
MIKIWFDTRQSSKEEREIIEQMIIERNSLIDILENNTTNVTLIKAFYEKASKFEDFDAFQRFIAIAHSPIENAEDSLKNTFEDIKNLESDKVFKYKDGSKIRTYQSFDIEHE